MANSSNNNPNGKRPRDEEDPETKKLIRVDSTSSIDSDASSSARANPVDEFLDMDSAETKKIQELLNILDDSEAVTEEEERLPGIQGLDSVIKSFEEEIQAAAAPPSFTVSESGDSSSPSFQPELGYLLEASDDELGLPPTNNSEAVSNKEEKKMMEVSDFTASPAGAGFDGMVGLENDIIPSYDVFDFGMGTYNSAAEENNVGGEYVALSGFFDYYSDVGGGGLDPEAPWRMESLSAL